MLMRNMGNKVYNSILDKMKLASGSEPLYTFQVKQTHECYNLTEVGGKDFAKCLALEEPWKAGVRAEQDNQT